VVSIDQLRKFQQQHVCVRSKEKKKKEKGLLYETGFVLLRTRVLHYYGPGSNALAEVLHHSPPPPFLQGV
jgi:hypothetical protein